MRFRFATSMLLLVGLGSSVQVLPAQFIADSFFKGFTEPGVSGSHIGVSLNDIDADRASELKLGSVTGAEVVGVQPGSPADQAGIRTGDVLLSYNSESIMGAQQLGRLVAETPVGRKVKIECFREGKVITVTATTAPGPPSRGILVWHDGSQATSFPGNTPWLASSSFPSARFVWTYQGFGIVCEALDPQDSQLAEFFGVRHGILIRSVTKDSPAAKAGLRAGDVVTQVGDHAVAEPKDITTYARVGRQPAKTVTLEIMRDHKLSAVKVSISPEP